MLLNLVWPKDFLLFLCLSPISGTQKRTLQTYWRMETIARLQRFVRHSIISLTLRCLFCLWSHDSLHFFWDFLIQVYHLQEESSNVELNSIRAIIKCVEDHKLESEFSIDSLRKRATHLEKAKAERKKNSAGSSKPQNKRGFSSSSGRGGGGSSSFRPAKAAKYSNAYSFSRRNTNPPPAHHSPAARYSGAYNYPVQSVYDGPAAAPYASSYGVPHTQSPAAIPQQHYSLQADNLSGSAFRSSGSYSGQTSYGPYDYANAGQQSYQPSSYPQ